jgi:hypothetical protein
MNRVLLPDGNYIQIVENDAELKKNQKEFEKMLKKEKKEIEKNDNR